MKEALCTRRKIQLVVIHRQDLTLERMRAKVGDHLPLRDLRGREALISLLASLPRK